jgi:hypothetical protein
MQADRPPKEPAEGRGAEEEGRREEGGGRTEAARGGRRERKRSKTRRETCRGDDAAFCLRQ